MKFLIDNNLSPQLADHLNSANHDAIHIRTYHMQRSRDSQVMRRARDEGRVLISADTDFGTLLAQENAPNPSVILLRMGNGRRVADIAALILHNLETVQDDLDRGSVVVFDVTLHIFDAFCCA